jgi:ribosomal protein S18 acetylase RimI-like enzyme
MWRHADPADDQAIIAMCRELNREDPGPKPVPDAHMESTLRALRRQPVRGVALVLEIDGRPRGYALLISFWSNELGGEICNIDELYVAPAVRGKGHASSLMRGLRSEASLWPGKHVALQLEVTPRNAKARALYSRLGFCDAKNTTMRIRP